MLFMLLNSKLFCISCITAVVCDVK